MRELINSPALTGSIEEHSLDDALRTIKHRTEVAFGSFGQVRIDRIEDCTETAVVKTYGNRTLDQREHVQFRFDYTSWPQPNS